MVSSGRSQRTAHTECISEFPGEWAEIFFSYEIPGKIPLSDFAREDQSCLEFMVVFAVADAVGDSQILLAVKPNYLFEYLIGSCDVLVFDIQHRIDLVGLLPYPEAILNSKPSEHGALVLCGLHVEV